jgi:hypothetical protein
VSEIKDSYFKGAPGTALKH